MANPKEWRLERDYDDEINGDGSFDTRKYDFEAVHRETGERRRIDTTPNRPRLPVEEWLLHCALDFPARDAARPFGGGFGPLTHSDLIAIQKEKERTQ